MTRSLASLLVLLIGTSSVWADPIPGLDDPAFRAPFDRALQDDDPTALTDLHAAAEAGNTAALLALPAVSVWLRASLPFSERKKLARINGLSLAEALAAADPVAAAWAMGDIGTDTDALLQRAFALYDAGEVDKATSLYTTWVNQTGGYGPLPPDFFDHPAPPWATLHVMWGRLNDTTFSPAVEADAFVVDRLKAQDPAAWLALAGYAGLHRSDALPPDTARLAAIFAAAGIPQDKAAQQMQDAVPVLKVMRYDPVDPATAEAATAAFRTEPEFQPLLTLCATICPATQGQCATAFVAGFGHPYGRATTSQPPNSLISTEDFFATPRGSGVLLRSVAPQLGPDPAASSRLSAARQVDACLADAILTANP